MITIRPATNQEIDTLTSLALASKSYWQYDAEYMEKCAPDLFITNDCINLEFTYVAVEEEKILGFYALITYDNQTATLDYFFLHPSSIGKGIGKTLWNHIVSTCKELSITSFQLEADFHAQSFYEKMGAKQIGCVISNYEPNAYIPFMEYTI